MRDCEKGRIGDYHGIDIIIKRGERERERREEEGTRGEEEAGRNEMEVEKDQDCLNFGEKVSKQGGGRGEERRVEKRREEEKRRQAGWVFCVFGK